MHIYMCVYTPIRATAPGGTGLTNSVLVATRESKRGESCKVSIHINFTHSHTLLNFLTRLPYSYYRELILILYSTSLLDFLLSLNIPIQSLLILREGCKVSITRVREN